MLLKSNKKSYEKTDEMQIENVICIYESLREYIMDEFGANTVSSAQIALKVPRGCTCIYPRTQFYSVQDAHGRVKNVEINEKTLDCRARLSGNYRSVTQANLGWHAVPSWLRKVDH